MTPPNILLIHVDQHRAGCLGVNGHPCLRTPHLDGLAAGGANFTHAFCPIAVCAPARTSLLTGLWSTQHGCIANPDSEAFHPMIPGLATFTQVLHDAGYFVAHIGKWHVDPVRGPEHFGCDLYVPESGYQAWRSELGIPPVSRKNGYFGEVDPHITPEQSRLAWGADQTIAALRIAASSGQPFFLRWDTSEPHLPNIVPEPYASLYVPESIAPWASFPDPLIGKPVIQRKQRMTWGIDGWSWHEWAPMVARYLGEISLIDAMVGRVLAVLDALGITQDTLVIYSADHGDLCGGHGLYDKHFVMYDELMRVPLIMRWPRLIEPGLICDAFVCSAIDLATTFCCAAGVQSPRTFMGKNLIDVLTEVDDSPRIDIFAAYHGNQLGLFSQRMVRDRRWKYIWNATAEDELYDLANDPGEITNVSAQPEYASELMRLQERMVAWMEQTHDRLLNSWTRRQLAG